MEIDPQTWIHAAARLPEPIEDAGWRDMRNAVLIYTPVDGMIHVGWYLGLDYRGHHQWITATATDRSYQHCTKKVILWMPVPLPEDYDWYPMKNPKSSPGRDYI